MNTILLMFLYYINMSFCAFFKCWERSRSDIKTLKAVLTKHRSWERFLTIEAGLEAIQFLRAWKLTELIQESSETKSLFPWLKPLYKASVQMSSGTSIYLPDNEENSIKVDLPYLFNIDNFRLICNYLLQMWKGKVDNTINMNKYINIWKNNVFSLLFSFLPKDMTFNRNCQTQLFNHQKKLWSPSISTFFWAPLNRLSMVYNRSMSS